MRDAYPTPHYTAPTIRKPHFLIKTPKTGYIKGKKIKQKKKVFITGTK